MAEWKAISLNYENRVDTTWFEFLEWRFNKLDEVQFPRDVSIGMSSSCIVLKVRDPKLIAWMILKWDCIILGNYDTWYEQRKALDRMGKYKDADIVWVDEEHDEDD